MRVYAEYKKDNTCDFVVWAPLLNEVSVKVIHPKNREIKMLRDDDGYWRISAQDVSPGSLYFYRLNNSTQRPDPASLCQPQGVHGPSEVVDIGSFEWHDAGWGGIPLKDMVIYELHIGTFTPEGTFEAACTRLDMLKQLGINAIEVMPVAQFPGERNWGYDGVYPYSVHYSYGGPEGFKKFVNECHKRNMALILDVVYNHLGPEGNYLSEFGPYFTDKYHTPWGKAINFDDTYSDHVRNFFIENALHWLTNYHIDALRLDAVHGIFDFSARHILGVLSEKVEKVSKMMQKKLFLIAESDLNDVRLIRKRSNGGYGIGAQWCDDFHHSLHALFTGERIGYYSDYGKPEDLIKALKEGFVYSGQYSHFRKRHYGSSSAGYPPERFVVCAQNHDQVGNRMLGERLSHLITFEALKAIAGILLMSPYIPLLFMGEEYAENAPFLYFVDHSDKNLIDAVRAGRKREFASFRWKGNPPDPQSVDTFAGSKLNWQLRNDSKHKAMFKFYQKLIEVRKKTPSICTLRREGVEVERPANSKTIIMTRSHRGKKALCILSYDPNESVLSTHFLQKTAKKVLDSSEKEWMGPGVKLPDRIEPKKEYKLSPFNFAIFSIE